ncbi:hypothetical protein THRCLA_03578 [Thraustotheca clavata]|uniref:Uncharacterized protein n=1 Tax=Thraustotheca clavata TaxID=74557 RepID=A0A1W0A1N3_9STRA|nr:hypothetical protein THRCLA_03578 [Thraustotheca clavata]
MAFSEWEVPWSENDNDDLLSWRSLCMSEYQPTRQIQHTPPTSQFMWKQISPESELISSSEWVFPIVEKIRHRSSKLVENAALKQCFLQPLKQESSTHQGDQLQSSLLNAKKELEEWKQKALEFESRIEEMVQQLNESSVISRQNIQEMEDLKASLAEKLVENGSDQQQLKIELANEKRRASQLESQIQTLHQTVVDMERKSQMDAEALTAKTNEINANRTKLESVQFALDECKEQLRQSNIELDRVRKDYTKVVYELTQLQRNQTTTQSENRATTNHLALLEQERDDLIVQLRHASAVQSRLQLEMASKEAMYQQQIEKLQAQQARVDKEYRPPQHIEKLVSSSQESPTYKPTMSETPLFPNAIHFHNDQVKSYTPSKYEAVDEPRPNSIEKPIPTYSTSPTRNRAAQRRNGPMSLAELGYGEKRNLPISSKSDLNSSSNIRNLLHHHAPIDESELSKQRQTIDTELSAPYATEKQSRQNDVRYKRELERQLLHLNLEKDQLHAEYAKLEQSGFKTIETRRRKSFIESTLTNLEKSINHLRMSLR